MEDLRHDLTHRFQADSVGRTLGLVGERWTLLILRETFFGVRRYGQLARNLGIPRPTLSGRLRTLVDACCATTSAGTSPIRTWPAAAAAPRSTLAT